MVKEKQELADKVLCEVYYSQQLCVAREKFGNWCCDIGECEKCYGLVLTLIAERLKEREQNG